MNPQTHNSNIDLTQRLDKWLWASRFFKTRKLASEAISGGKVHINGCRTKPGKEVKIGCSLSISKGSSHWEITVLGLCKQRRPASEACQLYEESTDSIEKREIEAEKRRQDNIVSLRSENRPTKKQRRQIHRFKRT